MFHVVGSMVLERIFYRSFYLEALERASFAHVEHEAGKAALPAATLRVGHELSIFDGTGSKNVALGVRLSKLKVDHSIGLCEAFKVLIGLPLGLLQELCILNFAHAKVFL